MKVSVVLAFALVITATSVAGNSVPDTTGQRNLDSCDPIQALLDTDGRFGNWLIAGKFPLEEGDVWQGIDDGAYPVAFAKHLGVTPKDLTRFNVVNQALTASNSIVWRPATTTYNVITSSWERNCHYGCGNTVGVDMRCEFGSPSGWGYAFTSFKIEGTEPFVTTLKLGCDNGIRVWLDAFDKGDDDPLMKLPYKGGCLNEGLNGGPPDAYTDVELSPGWHTILVQVYDDGGSWDFSIRMDPAPSQNPTSLETSIFVQEACQPPMDVDGTCEQCPPYKNCDMDRDTGTATCVCKNGSDKENCGICDTFRHLRRLAKVKN